MEKHLYEYELPPDRIANRPASPRDHSRLFVYDTERDEVTLDHFYNVARCIPPNSFLVLNQTKVVPAHLIPSKETGGKVELLLLVNEMRTGDDLIKGLSDRKITIGQRLFLDRAKNIYMIVERQEARFFYFRPNFTLSLLPHILQKYGITPIPKYIKHTSLTERELRKKYQTVFARPPRGRAAYTGSVAAPTASLHFTPRVFKKLERSGIDRLCVTLHVGMGTFAPITGENMRTQKLFTEQYEIEPRVLKEIARRKNAGQKLFAAGTTSVRALESFCRTHKSSGETDIFIFPPYTFKYIDGLITNFHLPGSSLMMLVEAFLQHKKSARPLIDLYTVAIKEKFRFYSFGDAMLIM